MKISASASYGLRENPKKSLRISDDSCPTSTGLSDINCKICGKGFSTSRQLCGHLRHHTIGERLGREVVVCKECGKRFKSIRSLCGHMKSHSSVVCDGIGKIRARADVIDCSLFLIPNVGVRKRARTPRFEVSRKRSHFENREDSSSSSSVIEEEVAASLIMLSQGLEFSNAAVDADGCCNVELVDQGLWSDGLESGKSLSVEITALVSCENISSKMDLDVCNPGESKNAELDTVGFSRVKDGQIELGGACIGNSELLKPEDGICSVSSSRRLKYRCIRCDKDFNSHQALGGHMSSKHRWRRCSKTDICQTNYPVGEGASKKPDRAVGDEKMDELCAVGVPHCELLKRCDHKCALCFEVFQSVQALGEHMRAHVAVKTMVDQEKKPGSNLRRCTSALKIETCHTIQTDPVFVAEGTSKKTKTSVNDVQKNETCSNDVAHFELLKKCKHKCAICFKTFRSAQALGAHIGAHVAESPSTTCQVQQPGESIQVNAVTELSMISQSPLASRKMVVS